LEKVQKRKLEEYAALAAQKFEQDHGNHVMQRLCLLALREQCHQTEKLLFF